MKEKIPIPKIRQEYKFANGETLSILFSYDKAMPRKYIIPLFKRLAGEKAKWEWSALHPKENCPPGSLIGKIEHEPPWGWRL